MPAHSPVSLGQKLERPVPSRLIFPCLLLCLMCLATLAPRARADQFGDFTYTKYNSTITIIYYTGVGGAVEVPGAIAGLPVRTIGDGAFGGHKSLTSVNIPHSVTTIGIGAFGGCTGLTSVVIGNGVTAIWTRAFEECTSLLAITVAAANTTYRSVDGVLFNKNETEPGLLLYPQGKSGSYAVPSGIAGIGSDAFHGCTGLTSVILPNSVTSIGYDAFEGCTGLTSVVIPNRVTSIGPSAFFGCSRLTSVTIGNSVNAIEHHTFYGCMELTSVIIGSSVSYIGPSAFFGCVRLTGVTIGNSLTSVGNSAFYGCTSLTSMTIPGSVTSVGGFAFFGCTGLTSVTIHGSATSIGVSAFQDCTDLTSAVFKGNAPGSFDFKVFFNTGTDFKVYYYAGSIGFTSPTWNGYASVNLGAAPPTLADWRVQHFGAGATNTGDAADGADPDGDGSTNAQEHAADTDPLLAGSVLRADRGAKIENDYIVSLPGRAGRRYELQRLLTTPGAAWRAVAHAGPLPVAESVTLTDAAAPADAALYRVLVGVP